MNEVLLASKCRPGRGAGQERVECLARTLRQPQREWYRECPLDRGKESSLKVAALVAGMVAGADSIDDMAIPRHGGMKKLFTGA